MQKIVAVFETEPDNFERLTMLLMEMQVGLCTFEPLGMWLVWLKLCRCCSAVCLLQEYGQPPSEIIKELAPGLQFSPDGMPLMPNMGSGFPGMQMPGMEGQDPAQPPCSIM